MRIVISGMFWNRPMVGSGQYLHRLLDALARSAPEHEYILLLPAYLNDRPPATDHPRIPLESEGRRGGTVVRRRWSVVTVRTPFDKRSENLAKLWYEQIGVPLVT